MTGPCGSIFSWNGNLTNNPGDTWWFFPLSIPNDACGGTYTYTFSVTYNGVTTSQSTTFTVNSPITPTATPTMIPITNDDWDSAKIINSTPYADTEDTSGATTAADDPNLCRQGSEAPGSATVWYAFTPSSAGTTFLNTAQSNYDTVLAVFTGPRGSLTRVACNDDYSGTLQSAVSTTVNPGVTYYIEVADYYSTTGLNAKPRYADNASESTRGGTLKLSVTFTPTATPTKTYTPSRTPTRTKTPTRTPTPPLITLENEDYRVQYDGWRGVKDTHANGGTYRVSLTAGDTISYTFTRTAIKWVTKKGPDQGIAQVTIDGASKPDVDLYSATPIWKSTQTYSSLKSGKHTIVIRVSGTKNPSATNTNVVFDAFIIGTTTTQDSSYKIQYNNWVGKAATTASGGNYRANGNAGAVAKLTFVGNGIQWITGKGPGYGQANVLIDGAQMGGTVDLYAPTAQWKVAMPFTGLSGGQHTIEIRPLGTNNAASTGTTVVVDALKGPITASAGMIEANGDQPDEVGPSSESPSIDTQGDSSWWFWLLPFGTVGLWLARRRA